jgi:hypothetical protein
MYNVLRDLSLATTSERRRRAPSRMVRSTTRCTRCACGAARARTTSSAVGAHRAATRQPGLGHVSEFTPAVTALAHRPSIVHLHLVARTLGRLSTACPCARSCFAQQPLPYVLCPKPNIRSCLSGLAKLPRSHCSCHNFPRLLSKPTHHQRRDLAHTPLLVHRAATTPPFAVALFFADNWGKKAIRRKTTGTGRMRYLSTVDRRFKNQFREGQQV